MDGRRARTTRIWVVTCVLDWHRLLHLLDGGGT